MGTDQVLKCEGCGVEFVWSVQEQEFYASRNFQPPKHCRNCRARRREAARARAAREAKSKPSSPPSSRVWTEVICDRCGKGTKVPFVPDPSKPVFCKECWALVREERRKEREAGEGPQPEAVPTA